MKKLLVAAAILAAFSSAQAVEVGVFAGEDVSHQDSAVNHSNFGATAGEHFGPVSASLEYARLNQTGANQNKYSVVAGYDVVKVGNITVTGKVGASYLDNQVAADGYAGRVGVGASVPLASKVSGTVDFYHQVGQERVKSFNGNTVTAGVKYSF
jgi:hypothetical protein